MISRRTSKIFRGIAILMVIFSHYAGWMYVSPTNPWWKDFISTWGVFGVDIFFLLSGYGLVKSASKKGITWQFMLNRLLACYIPYLLIIGFFTYINDGFKDLGDVRNFLIGKNYWYIYVQMVFYILFCVCYKVRYLKEITLSICVIAFTWWLWSIGRADFWELSNGAFLVGVYLATLEEKRKFCKEHKIIFAVCILALSGICMFMAHMEFVATSLFSWEMIRSMAFTCLMSGLCILIDYKSVVMATLGHYSLYIYLLHGFLFWKFIYHYEELGYLKAVVVVCGITLFSAVAAGFSIEKILDWCVRTLKKVIKNNTV